MAPLANKAVGGMRGISERAVVGGPLARGNPIYLGADAHHCVDESVEFREILALGRFDHQRARHRKRHRGSVESVVDEPLRDVVDRDAGSSCDAAQIEDALMGHKTLGPGVEHRE